MNKITGSVTELRLDTDDAGHVWAQADGSPPAVQAASPAEFLLEEAWQQAATIRMLASPFNAALFVGIWKGMKNWQQVWLGCPLRRRAAPGWAFRDMSQTGLAVSVGGWRKATEVDNVTYQMRLALQLEEDPLAESLTLLGRHPAFPAFVFQGLPGPEAAASVVSQIGDPRWRIDPAKPDAAKRLHSFCLLGGDGHKNMLLLEKTQGTSPFILGDILESWSGCRYPSMLAECVPPVETGMFAWRLAKESPGGAAFAALRASRAFLGLLCSVWLDGLTSRRVYGKRPNGSPLLEPASKYSPQLFVPDLFFNDQSDVALWRTLFSG